MFINNAQVIQLMFSSDLHCNNEKGKPTDFQYNPSFEWKVLRTHRVGIYSGKTPMGFFLRKKILGNGLKI